MSTPTIMAPQPQAASTSRSCERSAPLRGEKAPLNTAEPIVKASAPASASAAMRAGWSTLPATISVRSPQRAARRPHQVERLRLGRAIGEEVDAGAALGDEGLAMGRHVLGSAAQHGRMAVRKARKRVVADAAALRASAATTSTSVPPSSRSTPISRPIPHRAQAGLGRRADHLEIADRALRLDAAVQRLQHLGRARRRP